MPYSKVIFSIIIVSFFCFAASIPFSKYRSALLPIYKVPTPNIKYEDMKLAIKKDTSKDLAYIIDQKLLPYWLGTAWDFNGTTQVPGQGSIACGYFVTTLLRDAGIQLERVKLAQLASEDMIKILCKKEAIKRYHNTSILDFVASVKKQGYGLYVVGLDLHTGFILCDSSNQVYFIHSSGIPPYCVVKEEANSSPLLINSAYRVLGKMQH